MSNYREQFGSLPSQFKTGGGYVPWAHQEVKIAGNTLATVHFDSTKPNMFMLQNPNTTVIHVGISRIPTATNYEFKIEANSSATFGRPSQTDVVYLLNKGNADVVVSLFSINDKFEMSILQSLNVDLSKSPVFDGIITGFGKGASLPSGTNTLGTVNVQGAILTSLESYLSSLNDLVSTLESNSATGLEERWLNIGNLYNNGEGEDSINAFNGKVVKKIKSITNLGENPLKVSLYFSHTATSYKMFMVGAGETVRDLWTPDTRKIVVSIYDDGSTDTMKNAYNMVYLYESE